MIQAISVIGLSEPALTHLRLLHEHPHWQLKGLYDADVRLMQDLANQFQVKAFASLEEAINDSQALAITGSRPGSFESAKQAIMGGKHVYLEKPITHPLKEARYLQNLIQEAGVVFFGAQGHRYNPAFIAALPYLDQIDFIEINRLHAYAGSSTNSSVVLDLLMDELHLLLFLVKSNVRKIHAVGSAYVGKESDVVNLRLEFENGCVAVINASRLASKKESRFKAYGKEHMVDVHLSDRVTEITKVKPHSSRSGNRVLDPGNGSPKKELARDYPLILPTNTINDELTTFHTSVNSHRRINDSIDLAIKALELAYAIEEKLHF